jgi:hypothetical protein
MNPAEKSVSITLVQIKPTIRCAPESSAPIGQVQRTICVTAIVGTHVRANGGNRPLIAVGVRRPTPESGIEEQPVAAVVRW